MIKQNGLFLDFILTQVAEPIYDALNEADKKFELMKSQNKLVVDFANDSKENIQLLSDYIYRNKNISKGHAKQSVKELQHQHETLEKKYNQITKLINEDEL